MFRKLKLIALTIAVNASAVFGLGAQLAYAQDTTNVSCGAQGTITGACTVNPAAADSTINATVQRAIRIFQIVVGLISVFMLIFGGLKYITSGGDSGNVSAAKNTILYAVIGLVVVGLAQVIVQFALNRAAAPPGTI